MPNKIALLANILGYELDKRLLRQAVTHKSFTSLPENSIFKNNERLEFLGDSILGYIVSEYLYINYSDEPEGKLSKMKAVIVSEPSLAEGARKLNLEEYLILSDGEISTGGRDKESILSDAFEAVIAVIYISSGIDNTKGFIFKYLADTIDNAKQLSSKKDTKSMLQEITQEQYKTTPEYRLADEVGQDHDKTYTFEVLINGEVVGVGVGKNKKSAQQAASRDVLKKVYNIQGL